MLRDWPWLGDECMMITHTRTPTRSIRPNRVHFVLAVVHFLDGRPTGSERRRRRRRGSRSRRRRRRGGRIRLGRGPGQKVGPAVRYEVGGRYAVEVRLRLRLRVRRLRRGRRRLVMVLLVHRRRPGRTVTVAARPRHHLRRPVGPVVRPVLRPLRHAVAARLREQHRGFRRVGQHGQLRRGQVVRAAAAEHERVHAHADVPAVGVDALVHEHARALQAVHRTWFLVDLVIVKRFVVIMALRRFKYCGQ